MKKAIAMRCTKKQLEAIEPKLKGWEVKDIELNFKKYPYLTNNYGDPDSEDLGSHDKGFIREGTEIHETWNEKVFLEACGIETEPTYTLTKEQLKSLTDPQVKEWFPEVFKTVLEVGKWYVCKGFGYIINWQGSFHNSYGFTKGGDWYGNGWVENSKGLREATEAEVFEALKNEAVKRGFVEGVYYKSLSNGEIVKCLGDYQLCYDHERICFKDGVWAEIIPTKTKEEAEKELNCKIVD